MYDLKLLDNAFELGFTNHDNTKYFFLFGEKET